MKHLNGITKPKGNTAVLTPTRAPQQSKPQEPPKAQSPAVPAKEEEEEDCGQYRKDAETLDKEAGDFDISKAVLEARQGYGPSAMEEMAKKAKDSADRVKYK